MHHSAEFSARDDIMLHKVNADIVKSRFYKSICHYILRARICNSEWVGMSNYRNRRRAFKSYSDKLVRFYLCISAVNRVKGALPYKLRTVVE